MKQLYTVAAILVTCLTLQAQECDQGRYTTELFTDVTVTSAVVYGSNTGVAGGNQTLRMDVYEPSGDVLEARPVVLMAFGGSFIAGSRGDMAELCTRFAKMGYVAIAPDYRVGFFFPNEASTTRAVLRGAHDMKACVRFLRKSVAESDNPYRIDPDRIISGGVSAGAISSIHATYLNELEETPDVLVSEIASLGGIEGNSGSPGYSSEVLACVSFSGAIGDTAWIQPGDVPLVSVHEVGDGVVPYYTQEVSVIGIPTGLVASGSHDIHVRLDNLMAPNCFLSYPTNGHVGYLSSDADNALAFVAQFCGELVCGMDPTCGELTTGLTEAPSLNALSVSPNPTNGLIRFHSEHTGTMVVLDMSGREVMREAVVPGEASMDLRELPDGVYVLRIAGRPDRSTRVVVVK
ncbi:MAG: T9SS type A sorting domain-containing protein [Flavobacteriales bacterium]|nr:T9SS type A sorting domain-containing protein [Flavobacteriales bacterium]